MLEIVRTCDPSPLCESFPRHSLEWDYIFGLESGIPVCCVLEFCHRRHVLKQKRPQGLKCPDWPFRFVPCPEHLARWRARKALERLYAY
jgi:hypothetical protein